MYDPLYGDDAREPWTLDWMRRDYDWTEAMAYGPGFDACSEVIAADDGANDRYDWIAVFLLADGRFGFLKAGCDYTGWDCMADGDWYVRDDLRTLVLNDIGYDERHRLGFDEDGNKKENGR